VEEEKRRQQGARKAREQEEKESEARGTTFQLESQNERRQPLENRSYVLYIVTVLQRCGLQWRTTRAFKSVLFFSFSFFSFPFFSFFFFTLFVIVLTCMSSNSDEIRQMRACNALVSDICTCAFALGRSWKFSWRIINHRSHFKSRVPALEIVIAN